MKNNRKARREWMQKVTEGHKKNIAYLERSYADNVQRMHRELTRMIPKSDDDCIYPSGKIEHPYIRIPARTQPWHFGPGMPDPFMREASYYQRIEEFGLKAEQFALKLPDGQTVVWFGWRLA